MRRKNDKEIRKEFSVFLVLGIVAILFGMFILLYPIIPTTPYEEYREKEVVISEFDSSYSRHSSYDYIITEDGELYRISGDYNRSDLVGILTKGTAAVIKCGSNGILPFIKYAEEMIVDGNKIVTYNNDAPTNWASNIIFCVLFFLIGVVFIFAYRWQITRNRKLQAKRDARIIKKYGNIKK